MKIQNLFLAAACVLCYTAASAQTSPPISNQAANAPATMASPNTTRSSMSTAGESVGTVVTDVDQTDKQKMRDGQRKTKTHKTKSTMPDGNGKMKTKM